MTYCTEEKKVSLSPTKYILFSNFENVKYVRRNIEIEMVRERERERGTDDEKESGNKENER